MKKLKVSRALVALCVGSLLTLSISGCGKADPSTVRPVSRTIGSVVDAGSVALPNRPGYRLRHYEVLREFRVSHYLYVIEKDGVPVAGVDNQYQSGKTKDTVSTAVSPLQALRACTDVDDCVTKAEQLKKDTDYQKYLELKSKFE